MVWLSHVLGLRRRPRRGRRDALGHGVQGGDDLQQLAQRRPVGRRDVPAVGLQHPVAVVEVVPVGVGGEEFDPELLGQRLDPGLARSRPLAAEFDHHPGGHLDVVVPSPTRFRASTTTTEWPGLLEGRRRRQPGQSGPHHHHVDAGHVSRPGRGARWSQSDHRGTGGRSRPRPRPAGGPDRAGDDRRPGQQPRSAETVGHRPPRWPSLPAPPAAASRSSRTPGRSGRDRRRRRGCSPPSTSVSSGRSGPR